MRGTHFLASRHQRRWDFNIFTDSQASVTRIQPDVPGPDQDMAIEVIEPASNFREQDNTLTARRVPGHVGITGTEAVGTFANWRTWGEGERGLALVFGALRRAALISGLDSGRDRLKARPPLCSLSTWFLRSSSFEEG